jgi:hypothetical protein
MERDKSARGNASQFFVAGELCRRGYAAVVTHRLLLADFVCPQDPACYTTRDWWRSALGESPGVAIARFKSEGLLVEPNLDATLEQRFTAAELKSYLKAQGLKVSGRKSALATRLAAADPEEMRRIVSDQATLVCSETWHGTG